MEIIRADFREEATPNPILGKLVVRNGKKKGQKMTLMLTSEEEQFP